jgi:3-methyladenine DNA glycosylase AlkD
MAAPAHAPDGYLPLTQAMISILAAETIDDLLGLGRLTVPAARVVRRRLSARLKAQSGPEVIAIGLAIATAPAMKAARARWVGWELINKHRPALEGLGPALVDRLGDGISSWDEVDGFGLYISGPAWLRGLIDDDHVIAWAQSADLWRRRAALVSTVALNAPSHGGQGDAVRTLMIAQGLIDDKEDMVVKALSWALRVLIASDRATVEQFLADHEARLAARVRREVRHKLATGRKTAAKTR